jgi:hypothetical protein
MSFANCRPRERVSRIVAALQASPYRDIEIEPDHMPMAVRGVDL